MCSIWCFRNGASSWLRLAVSHRRRASMTLPTKERGAGVTAKENAEYDSLCEALIDLPSSGKARKTLRARPR